jgi:hypothetical protein
MLVMQVFSDWGSRITRIFGNAAITTFNDLMTHDLMTFNDPMTVNDLMTNDLQ